MRSIDVNTSFDQCRGVRPLLDESAPMLETMRIRLPGCSSVYSLPPWSSFFRGQFPALRTLHLDDYPLDLTQSALETTTGLTALVLGSRQSDNPRDLFRCLGHCKNLVHLRVDLPDVRGTVPAPGIVSLSNLRELQSDRSSFTALHHLSLPPTTNLTIGPRVREYVEGHPLTTGWEQDGLHQMLESRPITGIQITFDTSFCLVKLSGTHFVFTDQVKTFNSRHNSFYSICLDSFRSLPIATTEVLTFAQPPQRPFTGALLPESCTRLLLQMPGLTRIVLDPSVALSFVRALWPVNGQVPCPKLQDLVVIRREGREDHLRNGLVALSNQRKDHGCPLECSMGSADSSSWWQVTQLERVT